MKRVLILLVFLTASLSSVFLLPDFSLTGSAIALEIPKDLGGWYCERVEPSEDELGTLAKDTKFSKAICQKAKWSGGSYLMTVPLDRAELSIVLSGHDLANSIHRPERCMPAQGHDIYQTEKMQVEIPGHQSLPVRRLLSTRPWQYGPDKEKDVVLVHSLTYYFFVGHDLVTEDHTQRTLIDIKDRLLKGRAQRWAFVSATMSFRVQGESELTTNLPDFDSADKLMRGLLGDLAANNIDWNQIAN